MSANLPRRRRSATDREPTQRRDIGEARLWHIGAALAVSFTVAVLGLAGLTWLAWALLGLAGFRRHGALSLHDTVGVLQLVFASVAGAGALVALVVAYRRQKVAEGDSVHDRTRVFNERFTATAAQLGDDRPAVRLAGVHAMAGLADDWKANRQTCIDVLCAYLRMPYAPDPGGEAPAPERLAYLASREVRHTVIRVITAHLRDSAEVSWRGLSLDFTGVVFDGGDFRFAEFSGGGVDFGSAEFSGGTVRFDRAKFSGGTVYFGGTKFSGSTVYFGDARFSGGKVRFELAKFSGGEVRFDRARFSGTVRFDSAEFSGSKVYFGDAEFSGGELDFSIAEFSGGVVDFGGTKFSGSEVLFERAKFSGSGIGFRGAEFSGGKVRFDRAKFSGGIVHFGDAAFSGSTVSFGVAEFSGGIVDLSKVADWSVPPRFSQVSPPPTTVVRLPAVDQGQSRPRLRLVRRVILCLSSGYGEPTHRERRH